LRHRVWQILAAFTVVGLLFAMNTSKAAAAWLTISPRTIGPNTLVEVFGQSFGVNDTVNITVTGPGSSGSVTERTNGAGEFRVFFRPPAGGAAPGTYLVTATGTSPRFEAKATFVVSGAAATTAPPPAAAAPPAAAPSGGGAAPVAAVPAGVPQAAANVPAAAPAAARPAAATAAALPRTGAALPVLPALAAGFALTGFGIWLRRRR
jgi:hypothetical protein